MRPPPRPYAGAMTSYTTALLYQPSLYRKSRQLTRAVLWVVSGIMWCGITISCAAFVLPRQGAFGAGPIPPQRAALLGPEGKADRQGGETVSDWILSEPCRRRFYRGAI